MVASKIIPDVVDASETLNGSSYTIGWLVDSLRNNDAIFQDLHGDRPIKDVQAYDVSDGKGILSAVLRCTVTFLDSRDEKDVYKTILKIPAFTFFKDDFLTPDVRNKFTEYHKLECDFYNHIARILDGPTPKVHQTVDWILGTQEGSVHMEDLTKRGANLSNFESVNLTQVKCMIRHLAHMHKNILSVDTKIWKGKYLGFSNGFVDFVDVANEGVEAFLKKIKNTGLYFFATPALESVTSKYVSLFQKPSVHT